MAVTALTISSLSTSLFNDTANTNGAIAVKASSAVVSYIYADNSANGAATYLKIWNLAAASVVVGTTAPDFIVYCPLSTVVNVPLPAGLTFGTALSCASVTTAGTAGTIAPSVAITVRIAFT
jgi:hypothetical protein